MSRSDAELVTAACAGDIDSLRILYERHYGMAVGIARSRLFDQHLAEDAAQEAFATACRRLSSLRDTSRFPQWLGTICRRTASKMARSRTNGATIDREPVWPGAEGQDDALEIRTAINRLSSSAREVILLHYFSGLSHAEIAEALGISTQSVHGRLQRARHRLAIILATHDQ